MSGAPAPGTVLVVDDEERNVRLIAVILKSHGYRLVTAGGGAEALERAAAAPPDLIYLDVLMPGMNGFDVCRRLKEDHRTAAIPVVLVTALTDREARLEGLRHGAIDFLGKPVDATELMIKTRNLVRLKRCEDALRRHGVPLDDLPSGEGAPKVCSD